MFSRPQNKIRLAGFWGLCFLVLILAVYIRSIHLDFGLPQRLHPDEWSQVEVAQRISQGDLNPHFFRYPTGHMYFLAGLFKIRPLQKLPELYLSARVVSVLYSTATVFLTVVLGALLWNRRTALLAGALLALSYSAIEQSRYAVVDVPTSFWILAAFLAMAAAIVKKQEKMLWVAAVLTGIAAAHKYTAFLIIPSLWLSSWFFFPNMDKEKPFYRYFPAVFLTVVGLFGLTAGATVLIKKEYFLKILTSFTEDGYLETEYFRLYEKLSFLFLILGAGSFAALLFFKNQLVRILNPRWFLLSVLAGIVFSLITPFIFIEWRESLRDFFYEYRHMQIGSMAHYAQGSKEYARMAGMAPFFYHGLGDYLTCLEKDMGWLAFLFAALSFMPLWKKSKSFFCVMVLYIILCLGTISSWAAWAERYLIPVYPFFAILGAGGVFALTQVVQNKRISNMIFVFASVMLLVVPAVYAVKQTGNFLIPDTREAAWRWLSENLPENATVCAGSFAPDLQMLPQRITVRPLKSRTVLPGETAGCDFYIIASGITDPPPEKEKKPIAIFGPSPHRYRGRLIIVYK